MTPIKELGECVIGTGDREFFFRPSFCNMARIGEPEEIVQAFYDLCNDEATPFVQRAAEAYIRDEYSRLPDCVLRFYAKRAPVTQSDHGRAYGTDSML